MNETPTRSSASELAAWCAIVAAIVAMGAVIWMLVASPPDEGGGPVAVVEPAPRGETSADPTSRGRTDLASAADSAPPPRITPSPFVDPAAQPPSPRDGAEIDVEVLDPDGAPAADTMVLVGAADRHDCLGKKTSLAANLSRLQSPESRPDGIETGHHRRRGEGAVRGRRSDARAHGRGVAPAPRPRRELRNHASRGRAPGDHASLRRHDHAERLRHGVERKAG